MADASDAKLELTDVVVEKVAVQPLSEKEEFVRDAPSEPTEQKEEPAEQKVVRSMEVKLLGRNLRDAPVQSFSTSSTEVQTQKTCCTSCHQCCQRCDDRCSVLGLQFRYWLYSIAMRLSPPTVQFTGDLCFVYDSAKFAKNVQFPLERDTMRQLGKVVRETFYMQGYCIYDYTLEGDNRAGDAVPELSQVVVLMVHDWPTVNENAAWMQKWWDLFENPRRPSVPSKEQLYYCFEKSQYIADILGQAPELLPPTVIVRAESDLPRLSKHIYDNIAIAVDGSDTKKQFVTKENFSAGREGVQFPIVYSVQDVLEVLTDKLKNLKQLKTRHYYIRENFLVQQYVPEFSSQPEKRLYFIHGQFEYAVGHVGWIGYNDRPKFVPPSATVEERKHAYLLMEKLPMLRGIPVVRLDFGPFHRLNEIEILPDFFGGPEGTLEGKQWPFLAKRIAEAYTSDIYQALHRVVVAANGGTLALSTVFPDLHPETQETLQQHAVPLATHTETP